jgi:PAS domain S-box-containing protein
VHANIVGIFVWDSEGRILEANVAFLRIVRYDREDIITGRLRWTELTPPEWLDRERRLWVPQLKTSGSLQPFGKEYFRKDGSRVPVLVGAARFEESGQGVASVLDLSARKQAEAALRGSEEQWRAVFENNPVMYFMVDAATAPIREPVGRGCPSWPAATTRSPSHANRLRIDASAKQINERG